MKPITFIVVVFMKLLLTSSGTDWHATGIREQGKQDSSDWSPKPATTGLPSLRPRYTFSGNSDCCCMDVAL